MEVIRNRIERINLGDIVMEKRPVGQFDPLVRVL